MLTLIFISILVPLARFYPVNIWCACIVLFSAGILGVLQETAGLKPWVFWALEVLFCLLGIKILSRQPFSSAYRFALLLLLATGWLFIYGIVVNFSMPLLWTSFFGGFTGIFILAYLNRGSFWRGLLIAIGIQLFISVCVFYLTPLFPALGALDGVRYNQKTDEAIAFTGEFARGLIGSGQGMRGGGLFANQNSWAQVSGWSIVVGCALFLAGKKVRSKAYGLALGCLGVAGLLGSMGRSATFAACIAFTLLMLDHLIGRSRIGRFVAASFVIMLAYSAINYARGLFHTTGAEIGSDRHLDYRINNFLLLWSNINDYWLAGRQGQEHLLDPHDLLAASLYNFGVLGLLVIVLCLIGGIILMWQWFLYGSESLKSCLGFPAEYGDIAALAVVPLFIFYILASLGNGLAGGMPYNTLFFLFGYFGWNILRIRSKRLRI